MQTKSRERREIKHVTLREVPPVRGGSTDPEGGLLVFYLGRECVIR